MTQESSPLNALMEEYREVQRRVIMWNQDLLPDHMPLYEWRKGRRDQFKDDGYCSAAIKAGRLPGAIRLGRSWFVPRDVRPIPLKSAPKPYARTEERTGEGLKL